MSENKTHIHRLASRWIAVAAMVVLCGVAWGRGDSAAAATTPSIRLAAPVRVLPRPLPDPCVVRGDDGEWWVFGTGTTCYRGSALRPDAMRAVPLDIAWPPGMRPPQIWAFKPFRLPNGQWWAYAGLHHGFFQTTIGCFRLNDPGEGDTHGLARWKFDEELLGNSAAKQYSGYDPLAVNAGGRLFLMWTMGRADGNNHLMMRQLAAPNWLEPLTGAWRALSPEGLRSEDRNPPGGMQLIEAPSVHRFGNWLALFYSVGDFAGPKYKIGVAWARADGALEGAWFKKVRLEDGGDEVQYLLQSEDPARPNYIGDYVKGPGAGSIVEDGGRMWLVFHGYPADAPGPPFHADDREVWKTPLETNINAKTPTRDWLKPGTEKRK